MYKQKTLLKNIDGNFYSYIHFIIELFFMLLVVVASDSKLWVRAQWMCSWKWLLGHQRLTLGSLMNASQDHQSLCSEGHHGLSGPSFSEASQTWSLGEHLHDQGVAEVSGKNFTYSLFCSFYQKSTRSFSSLNVITIPMC